MTAPLSRYVAEMAELRQAVETMQRLWREHQRFVDQRVSNCLSVTREVSHRLLVLENLARGE